MSNATEKGFAALGGGLVGAFLTPFTVVVALLLVARVTGLESGDFIGGFLMIAAVLAAAVVGLLGGAAAAVHDAAGRDREARAAFRRTVALGVVLPVAIAALWLAVGAR